MVAGVMFAELNFWYWVSTGENDVEVAAAGFFALWAAYWIWIFSRERRPRPILAGLGAIAAAALMVLRLRGIYDPGYIPPYVVFIAFALLAFAIDGPSTKTAGAPPGT